MRNRVYLYSTLRQPVKMAMLLLVMALATFAFVSRSMEYLIVRQETERLGEYYQSIGTLESTATDKWADTGAAVKFLEDNPYVKFVDTYHYTSGVIQSGFTNADTDLQTSDMSRYAVFYGTLWSYNDQYFHFVVDSVITGHPEYIYEGISAILYRTESQDIPDAASVQLVKGERYLVIGYYSLFPPSHIEYDPSTGRMTGIHMLLSCPLKEDIFYHVPEGQEIEWSDPKLEEIADFVFDIRDEQSSLNIISTKDMSSLPLIQGTTPQIYLTNGRWLDSGDNTGAVKSCVIHAGLASSRNLAVGDLITIQLRDIPSCFGYDRPYPLWKSKYFYHPLKVEPDGSFSEGDARLDTQYQHSGLSPREVQTCTETFEIVGIYDYTDKYQRTVVRNFAYIPASAVPESFSMTTAGTLGPQEIKRFELIEKETYISTALPAPGAVSFVLKSPEMGNPFLDEARSALAPLGFQIFLIDNGWDAFQATVEPMRRSSLLNASVFAVLLVVTFALIAVIYYRIRLKEVAITRALGVPAKNCAWGVSVPLSLTGLMGVGIGGMLGWWYTINHAESFLQALSEFSDGKSADIPAFWMTALLGGALLPLVSVSLGGAFFLSTRPVLALIQGGGIPAARKANMPAGHREAAIALTDGTNAPPPISTSAHRPIRSASERHVGVGVYFVWQHIVRARSKSVLAILLAAGFTVGLAAIRLSISGSREKIDWLYENTEVGAELLLADTAQTISGGGFLRQDTIDILLGSGYITSAYLEGSAQGTVIRYTPETEHESTIRASEEDALETTVRAFADEEVFLSPLGSGGAVTITYFEEWNKELFIQEWTEDRFPVVVPKAVHEQFGNKIGLYCKGFQICDVAGYYEGSVAGNVGETEPILLPLSAYQAICGTRMATYTKAHVTLDPGFNRDLDRFYDILNRSTANQGSMLALHAVIWDEELRQAVAPLETSIDLMQVLYPITLVLSLMVSIGVAVLFSITSAKEAAIMRILGTSRLQSQVVLSLQAAGTNLLGVLIGLFSVFIYSGQMQPKLLSSPWRSSVLCAVLYLLSSILGAMVSASIVTSKNPLEMLQVKE